MKSLALFNETLQALLRARRAVPLLFMAASLLFAQGYYSPHFKSLVLAMLMCVAFVVVAPFSYRWLFRKNVSYAGNLFRWCLYFSSGLGIILGMGSAVPRLFHMKYTFLTAPTNLLVVATMYVVGGWGLGRDINLEVSLEREKQRSLALEREAERAQLLALKSHLDPHFLFNTLNAIAEWCREDGETAERAVLQLSSLLRKMLEGVKASTWQLEKEENLVRELFSLHHLRNPNAFSVEVRIPEELRAFTLPPMLLLPLAENAIKHGPARGHRGVVRLVAHELPSEIEVRLDNPGPFRGPREGSDGLPMVQKRLSLTYGELARLNIQSTSSTTSISVFLPKGRRSSE